MDGGSGDGGDGDGGGRDGGGGDGDGDFEGSFGVSGCFYLTIAGSDSFDEVFVVSLESLVSFVELVLVEDEVVLSLFLLSLSLSL